MDQNVLSMSPSMLSMVNNIIVNNDNTSSFMGIDVIFRTSENTEFVKTFTLIRSMTINQSFLSTYTDVIDLELEMQPKDYEDLYANSKGLYCEVIGRRVDEEYEAFPGDIIFRWIGRAIWRNKRDPSQEYSKADMQVLEDDETQPLIEKHYGTLLLAKFQLIDAIAYDLRHIQATMILKGVTMKQTCRFLIERLLGSNLPNASIEMYPPDNKKTYTNMVIDPMQNISSIFTHIQNKRGYGIYNKGINHYFTGNTFYLYPPFELEAPLANKPAVHFYYVGRGKLSSSKGYSKLDPDGTLHVLSDQQVTVTDTSDETIERFGNALMLMNSETLIDHYITASQPNLLQNPIVKTNNGILSVFNLLSDHGIVDLAYNPRYMKNNGNTFSKLAELNAGLRIKIEATWLHAAPFSITPTSRIYFHYDDDMIYTVKPGLCHFIKYTIHRVKQMERMLYGCTAKLVFFVSSKK